MFKKIIAASMALSLSPVVLAEQDVNKHRLYEVTVTNITKGQSFTPILSATHNKKMQIFSVGMPASEELAMLAEGGNTAPLQAILDDSYFVKDTYVTEGLLLPGQSVTYSINGKKPLNLSLAAMLIPTNDTFVSLNSVKLPKKHHEELVYFAHAYDAGTETNDEICSSIPGPVCGGEGTSNDDDGEGYIYPSMGIHGEADLAAKDYDWRGAAAKVVIKRQY
jgi:hypothetical protein